MTVLDRFYKKDRSALSRIISFIENREDGYLELLSRIYNISGNSYKIGITGPPGSGKSTLVDKIAIRYLDRGYSVGIIAVDPTSPFTGGALLGDRIRMQDLSNRGEVFIRSMATRGSGGGLSEATREVAIALESYGFDIILIETVGVGQVELDVAGLCDSTVVVLVPESGDSVQTLKAGLMEIADIFAVNKADREGSGRLVSELRLMLESRGQKQKEGWILPVIKTEAINGVGTDTLTDKIIEHRKHVENLYTQSGYREKRVKSELITILDRKIRARALKELLEDNSVDSYVKQIVNGESDPYSIAEKLLSKITI